MSRGITSGTCPCCDSNDTDVVESDTDLTGSIVVTCACNKCYAGWEDTFTRQDREITHEPEVSA